MQIFATLYLASVLNRDGHFALLKRLGYKPELYFNTGWDALDASAHRETARIVNGELGGCGVHLPYGGMLPGSPDPARAGRETLRRAAGIASLYDPAHLVGHVCFRPLADSEAAPAKHLAMGPGDLEGPLARPSEAFLENSLASWKPVMENCPGRLFLENTSDRSPCAVRRLLDLLPPGRAGMCLDIGHWHHSGMGVGWRNLGRWLDIAGDRVGHLHIHDNDGSADQHLPLGAGRIDFAEVWRLVAERGLDPSATVENHDPEGLAASGRYLAAHPYPPAV
ncbi:MAG: sugar phosphate isomerase/epimerase [Deltaproteobacteria bacterium]|jgi:sugar phosphate isomerase/epimerase|nr:sugar phosphate isomerase/epimerase [Deltaproteobacteria bacterium]